MVQNWSIIYHSIGIAAFSLRRLAFISSLVYGTKNDSNLNNEKWKSGYCYFYISYWLHFISQTQYWWTISFVFKSTGKCHCSAANFFKASQDDGASAYKQIKMALFTSWSFIKASSRVVSPGSFSSSKHASAFYTNFI